MWPDNFDFTSNLVSLFQYNGVIMGLAILILFLKYIMYRNRPDPRHFKFASTLPGPYALPIVGNSLSILIQGGKKGPVAFHDEYIKKYGSVYRLWINEHLFVALSDIEDIQEVLQSSKTLGRSEVIKPFINFFGYGLAIEPSIHRWRLDRKRLQPFFTKDYLKSEVPEINAAIQKFVQQMKKHVDGPEFDVLSGFTNLSFDIITRTKFGTETDSNERIIITSFDVLEKTFGILGLQMHLPFLRLKFVNDILYKIHFNAMKDRIMSFTKSVISKTLLDIEREILQAGNQAEEKKKLLLAASYKLKEESGDEKLMLEEVFGIMLTGTEAAAVTMSFVLLMIAMHPDVQDKLYEEIHGIFGDDDRVADQYDVECLSYLDQVIKETNRRFIVTPMLLREVVEDVKIGPHIFPAGTGLMINTASVHSNPKYYPEPLKFNPDNFSPEAVERRSKYTFLAFSAGSRMCIGKHLAELEVKLAIVALLRTFSFQTSMKLEDITIKYGFIAGSSNGYPISIKWRNLKKQSKF